MRSSASLWRLLTRILRSEVANGRPQVLAALTEGGEMSSVAYVLARYPVDSQTFVHAEMVALGRLGVDIRVFTHQRGEGDVRFGDGPDGAPLPIEHVGLFAGGTPDPVAVAKMHGIDHLHGHFADFGVRVVTPLAEAAARPFSFTAHAYDLFRRDAAVRPEEWRALSPKLRRVVAISRFHREFLISRGVPAARIAVIPNAAALADLLQAAPPAPTRLRRILAVGRPVAKKGFANLVQAWAQLKTQHSTIELEIIGGAGLVADPPPGLRLSPMMPWTQVVAAMKRADLVVAPCVVAPDGDMDGIPTVLAEAGALRRPVVVSNLSGVGDLVAHGVNGLLVPPGDVHALAMAFCRLAQRPDELQRMGNAGPTLAACHDADVVAVRLQREAFAA